MNNGRSREGAWIEILLRFTVRLPSARRSREGAWIEILEDFGGKRIQHVAPVRERGLKCPMGKKVLRKAPVAPVRERGLK